MPYPPQALEKMLRPVADWLRRILISSFLTIDVPSLANPEVTALPTPTVKDTFFRPDLESPE